MSERPKLVALILPPVPAYSQAVMEGVIERQGMRRRWRMVDLPHLRIGHSPLPAGGVALDAVIVWADRRDDWIERLVHDGVRVVNCGSDWLGVPGVASVRARLGDIGAVVTRHFAGLGFQHLVCIGHLLEKRQTARQMLGNFAETAAREGMTSQVWDLGGHEDPGDDPKRLLQPETEERLIAFLGSLPKHVAIFCENDHVGVIVCRVAALLGLRIPDDLAVMGYGDNLVARFSDPPLTSIAPPGHAIGRAAAATLSEWMDTGVMPRPDQVIGGIELRARESTIGSSGSVELERIRRRIAMKGARGLTITDLVGLSGISSKTLVRRYQEAYGIDPAEEIRRLRLDQAKRMLRETDQPIAEIAALCGFSSQAGFYNYFMRHTRTCPSEFRKAGKEAVQEAEPNHLLGG